MESTAQAAAPERLAEENADLRRRLAEATSALQEMRERDSHLRMAMQASRVVAYQWDIVHDRVTRLRGSSEPGMALEDAGSFESVVRHVLPEDQATFCADIAAALIATEGLYRTEVRYRHPDGQVRWLLETGRVIRDERGEPVRMVGLTFDITDRKEAEERLRHAEAQLREQAQRKDEFLAMLAHELRNPLAPIRNAVQILRLMGVDEGKPANTLALIERQVGHLVRLVDDLLDVSRVSRGKVTLQLEDIDLREAVSHALDLSRPQMLARGHRLDVSLPAQPVAVRGDFTRLAQVVNNLLNNAAKYSEPGGHVRLLLEVQAAQALLTVADDGRGMDPTELARAFEIFYQGERPLDRAEGGLGVGLSLVRSLLELHGGSVEAESAGRGRGSTFRVRLPLRAS